VGGGETQARALAEGLVAEGLSVIVLTRRSDAKFKKVEQYGAVTVYRLPPVGKKHYKKWGLLFTAFPALLKLRRKYELIFVAGFRVIGIPAVLTSRLIGKTCILKADSSGEMSGDFFRAGLAKLRLKRFMFFFRLFLALRNRILRRADAFVGISSELITELLAHGVEQAQIHNIPNSVDTGRFCPVEPREKETLRRHLQLPAEKKIVIYTGRLVFYKGLPVLVQAWREIQRKHENVLLLLVGEGGLDIHNCEAALKADVAAYGLDSSVLFTGSVPNVYEYLQAADIFVFPTETEAFGISLIEAMACSLPAVSSAVEGVKDIIEHQQNGLVAAAGDSQQIYWALDQLISDQPLSIRLGHAARQTVQDKYAVQIVLANYIALFRQASFAKETESSQKLRTKS
jgi:glycosyltransferase involved in cell wall biosynthesis